MARDKKKTAKEKKEDFDKLVKEFLKPKLKDKNGNKKAAK